MREAFDGALTGCRMTLAALNLELDKLVEPKEITQKGAEIMKIGFTVKRKVVWKENIMKQLLDQTRGQMSSLQSLIQLLESETQADVLTLLKQNAADIRRIFHRAKSIRFDQGVDDDQSSFDLAHQSLAYELVPSYEAQLSQSSTYQRAQTAAAEELLARKIELLDEKYALEEMVEALRLDVNLKDEKVTQLEHEIMLRDGLLLSKENVITASEDKFTRREEIIGRLENDILLQNEHLLSQETRITGLEYKINQSEEVKNGMIHWVARNGCAKAVDQLLREGANKEALDEDGLTALHIAAICGHVEVAEILLENGANKEAVFGEGLTALHKAALGGRVTVVKIFQEKGAKKQAGITIGSTALHLAAISGNVELVKILLKKSANTEAMRIDRVTALHIATFYDHVDVVEILLEKGANKEAVFSEGVTALNLAASRDHVEVVKTLLEKGANKEAAKNNGFTSLHTAAYRGNLEVVKILVQNGANTETADEKGHKPLHVARRSIPGYLEIVKILDSSKEATSKNG